MFNEIFVSLIAYLVPIYIANASALLFGGGLPLDFNKKLFGKPILGRGKTFKGTFSGIFFGSLSVFIIAPFIPEGFITNYYVFGIMLVLGAITGDIVASFIKRRLGLKRGAQAPLLDQLDFVAGSFLFTLWIRTPTLEEVIIIVLITLTLHRIANYIAYKIKLKEVPW